MKENDLKSTQRASTTYLIARVFHALRSSRIEPILKPFGITPLQYTILTVIMTHEGLSSADLSRRFYVTPQTMGQVLASLEETGLLKRREDPENRRVLRVAMTAEGRKLVKRCDKQMEKIELEVFGEFDDSEVIAFRRKLYKVAAVLRGGDQATTAAEPVTTAPITAKRKRSTSKT